MSPSGAERRTGWDRRISERRGGQERRRRRNRRGSARDTPQVLLRWVAVNEMRHLVSQLYHQTKKMRRPSNRVLTQLAEIRTEFLRAQPDVARVGTVLKKLKSSSAARLPEYQLALELLPTLSPSEKQAGAQVLPFTKPETVRRAPGKTTAKTGAKPKPKSKGRAKKKTTKRKTMRKKSAKGTTRKRAK